MTLAKLIALVKDTRPNPFSEETLTLWANEVEHKAYADVVCRALFDGTVFQELDYTERPDQKLLIPDQFGDAYLAYLYSKIDFTTGEVERYANDAAMFDAAFEEYSGWYMRTHYPNPYEFRARTSSGETWNPEGYAEELPEVDLVWYRRLDDPDPLELDSHFGLINGG